MTEIACSCCGKGLDVKPYRLARNVSGLIFCSVACRKADGRTTGKPPVAPNLTCPICGRRFHRKAVEIRETNYCSYACAAKGTGNLQPTPKGVRRSVATEFKPGQAAPNQAQVGTVRLRRHRDDTERAWAKVADPNVWRLRAIVVWEAANGPIPKGLIVHHRNRDTLDDRLENLEAIDRASHLLEHRPEFEEKRQANRAAAFRRRAD